MRYLGAGLEADVRKDRIVGYLGARLETDVKMVVMRNLGVDLEMDVEKIE